ncbi:MAG: penicillin-binding protein 1B [Pseudomonadota bacterium]
MHGGPMAMVSQLLVKVALILLCCALALVFYLDGIVTSTFQAKRYALPAMVYARPLELYVGARQKKASLVTELELLGYRRRQSVRAPGEYELRDTGIEVYTRGFEFPDGIETAIPVTVRFNDGLVTALQSSTGELDLLRLEPLLIGGIYPKHGEDRLLLPLSDAPPTLLAGLKLIEDRDFDSHLGFSVSGISRAALGNIRSGRVVAGGSTITQQLVKNYYLSPERTLRRKLVELAMAVLIELHFSKEEILESYLNEIYLGQDGPRAIHGFALASLHYFDTPLEDLGLHQQALLVGMIRGPSLYNPWRNPERALERRNLVLRVMAAGGAINDEQALVAQAMPLSLRRGTRSDSFPAYLDLVRHQLLQQYEKSDYGSAGLTVFTPFDPQLQQALESGTERVLNALNPAGDMQTGSVVTRTSNGEVVALVGGRIPGAIGFNRALNARRPAGSLLKPVVYLAALLQPQDFTLATLVDDSAFTVEMDNGKPWSPRNFDRESHGRVPLHTALARSYNQATARLAQAIGLDGIVATLSSLGVTEGVARVPSLALGAGEYSPLAMTRMYLPLAKDGSSPPLRAIRFIVNRDGVTIRANTTNYERAIDPRTNYLLQYALREAVKEGTGKAVYRYLPADFHVAGKTGTTNDGRDSWFAGFSNDLLSVVWIGRDNNKPTGLTGASGALRIWGEFMAAANSRPLANPVPEGIELHRVDDSTGELTGEGCPNARLLPFVQGSHPVATTSCRGNRGGVRNWFERLFRG